ncbi:MAG: bifunctional phosphopantothenoylcysteine decarboxylase/phosphopantothenate--cysteine ligase CoaBC, partial [Gammaproteobacteria bacterium]|nr:bifunctional phosphopantothenoylcysteine decarboxylase/phosphopantothenate--cysteine ligase CoaBC [Gammaproteobacteria bacterium]
MASLQNKRILLGVTGGIAAYKSADLVRRLREAGAEVRVVMTDAACEFITELTLQAVSGAPVLRKLLDTEAEAAMSHIQLARWADAVLIAPASADFLARLVQGRGDDLLTTVCLASAAPLAVAPAMNQQMWRNTATQANITTLQKRGVHIFGPGEGSQACGDVGPGRMLEPTELTTLTSNLFETGVLDGLRVVVTAGPTWEALDPVRGITNHSSGKMGYAVAEAARDAGARVTLVSGPVSLPAPERMEIVQVVSAQQMFDAALAAVRAADIFIGVAAVADYRPAETSPQKIKKSAEKLTLELIRNPDILAAVAALKPAPFTVGFAAETGDLETAARAKLAAKNVDLVCANLVGGDEGGFGADDNRLLLVDRDGRTELPLAPKSRLARELIQHLAGKY